MKRYFPLALFFTLLSCSLFFISCDETGACAHKQLTATVMSATCDKEGYTLNLCADCGFQFKTELIPPTGHTLTETVFAPTCTEEGHTYYHCACGYFYKGAPEAPSGHAYTERTVEPTCETEGYTERLCAVCSYSYKSDLISALGHELSEQVHKNSCTEGGYTEYICSRDDLTYRAAFTEPTGHTLTTTHVKHPTVTAGGSITQRCAECTYSFTNYVTYTELFPGAYSLNTAVLARGIDVSVYQHKPTATGYRALDWGAIKEAGFDFAILKAGSTPRTEEGEEKGGQDPVFEMNYRDAKEAGLDLGVYFYTYATTAEALRTDAGLLIEWLQGKQFEYPIYFDLEDPSLAELDRDTLTEFCMIFITTLREAGYYGGLYTNNDWLVNRLNTAEIKGFCDIWYARYRHNDPITPDDPFIWQESYGGQLGMWQYSQMGTIEGSDIHEGQPVDFNYAYKDYPSLIKKFGFNGYMP